MSSNPANIASIYDKKDSKLRKLFSQFKNTNDFFLDIFLARKGNTDGKIMNEFMISEAH